MAVVATSLVAVGPGMASADEDRPVRDVVGQVRADLEQHADQAGQQAPSGPDSSESAKSAGDPEKPGTKAKAEVAELDLQGQDVLDLARSEGSVDDTDRARGDATFLALGGQEVMGAHADSADEKEAHAGDPFAPLCEGSEGQLCLRVLFADAYADEGADSSEGSSQTGVADLCLGGDSADQRAECRGPVSAEVLKSSAWAKRDKGNGDTASGSESAVADVCLSQDGQTCDLGVEVLGAQSSASSDGETEGDSTLVGVEGGGQEVIDVDDPANVEIQPDCAEPSLACLALNEGSSTVEDGTATQTQDALNAGVLPDTVGVDAGVSRTEASATAGEIQGAQAERPAAGGPGRPGNDEADEEAGVLPDTGGFASGLLSVALGALAAGAFLVARNRRRQAALL